ncbi:MAG TPA: hypothetical protein VGK19_05220 [Capsulimonadaceae bacterium]|jgi:hypothetical protein
MLKALALTLTSLVSLGGVTAATPIATMKVARISVFESGYGWALGRQRDRLAVLRIQERHDIAQIVSTQTWATSSACECDNYEDVGTAFVTSRLAFVALFSAVNELSIKRTDNGGGSWTSAKFVVPDSMEEGTILLTFADSLHGYLLLSSPHRGFHGQLALYTTADSGRSWSRKASSSDVTAGLPTQGRPKTISFISPREGWIGMDLGGISPKSLLHTTDGGSHWTGINVDNFQDIHPQRYTIPVLIRPFHKGGAKAILFFKVMGDSRNKCVVYLLKGTPSHPIYTKSGEVTVNSSGSDLAIASFGASLYFVDPSKKELYVGSSVGAKWRSVRYSAPLGGEYDTAWLYAGQSHVLYFVQAVDGAQGVARTTTLLRSGNDGKTWQRLSLRQPPDKVRQRHR